MSALRKSHSRLLCGVCCTLFFSCPAVADPAVNTVPQGGQVIHGNASITYPNARHLQVNQTSDRAVINWSHFNIGANGKASFVQPNSNALVVNRVTGSGQNPTEIFGTIEANGRVMVLDRNGVIFGKGSTINVGGIIAAAGDIDMDSLRNEDKIRITSGKNGAEIVNAGNITVKNGGLAALVAPNVRNDGSITAKMGKIELAGAQTATIDLYGDGMIQLAVHDAAAVSVNNTGSLNAENGHVRIRTEDATAILDNVVSQDGTINAGNIEISARDVKLSKRSTITAAQNLKITAQDNISIQTTGPTNLTALNGDIALTAGKDITLQTGNALGAALNITANKGTVSLKAGDKINIRTGSGRNASIDVGGYNIYLETDKGDIAFSEAAANQTLIGAIGGELSILPGGFFIAGSKTNIANILDGKLTIKQNTGGDLTHIFSVFSQYTDNTLILGAGSYVLPRFNLQNIRIKGADGSAPTFISGNNHLEIYGGSLSLDGLIFTGSLDLRGFDAVNINNSLFTGDELLLGQSMLNLFDINRVQITDTDFTASHNQSVAGIYSDNTHNLSLVGTSFKNLAENAVQIIWSGIGNFYRGTITIQNTLFANNGTALEAIGAGSIHIYDSSFSHNDIGIAADLENAGYAGDVSLAGTLFADNRIGAFLVDSRLDVRTHSPVFTGGEYGLVLDGRLASLAGNTLGNMRFSNQQNKAVNLQNYALLLSDPVNGREVDWGFTDYKGIESKLTHQTSSLSLGKIDFGLKPPKTHDVYDDIMSVGRKPPAIQTEILNVSIPALAKERGKVTISGLSMLSLSFSSDAESLAMIETAAGSNDTAPRKNIAKENCSETSWQPFTSAAIFTGFSSACDI